MHLKRESGVNIAPCHFTVDYMHGHGHENRHGLGHGHKHSMV
jgi:hypothetical protein